MERAIDEDPSSIACVISTNCCFAPRAPERIEEVAMMCLKKGVPHLVNNAYGTQCHRAMHSLNSACSTGRVDGIVCSTDKNFLVPVGGSILACAGLADENKTLVSPPSSTCKFCTRQEPHKASSASFPGPGLESHNGRLALAAAVRTTPFVAPSGAAFSTCWGGRILKAPSAAHRFIACRRRTLGELQTPPLSIYSLLSCRWARKATRVCLMK